MIYKCIIKCVRSTKHLYRIRFYSTIPVPKGEVEILGRHYPSDNWTNVTPRILSHVGRNLHLQEKHPLSLLRARIVNHIYSKYVNRKGNPIFSVYDKLNPVVSTEQNFDSLLIPTNHPSRLRSDCYYVNKNMLLRAHTTAHQAELLAAGLNAFIMMGDVYRRDEIDASHYPVFHQLDAVRLYSKQEVFKQENLSSVKFLESGEETPEKQECHSLEVSKFLEQELKLCLENLARNLFGNEAEIRWVESIFPFTHPSWELEVLFQGKWLELLGCGVMKQKILENCGVTERVGWAFGVGLERLAMCLYSIPDIRLFWSTDSGFLSQFSFAEPETPVTYKPISQYPQCKNDISFWLPENNKFEPNDFYELVRGIGGDIVEQVSLVDKFQHPKTQRHSHCYRITYRHMERTLTQAEVNQIHQQIAQAATQQFGITIR
ncbi:hypothetical protein B566_EDAN014021 [Ephemera danica]|nr:hypothetical protein B566_EDAN014021 [Ephemera danica]